MQILRKLAFPFACLYGIVVMIRNFLYDVGIFNSSSYKFPIICVGNLSLGGTGKTPMIEYLIRELQDNYKIAVLSRGYKRKTSGLYVADHYTAVEDIGDEPFQIFSKFPNTTMVVDADRRVGIEFIVNHSPVDLILLDDAFQHRRVKAGLNILLTDYHNLYTDDFYIPTGYLRDSRAESKRADFIIVTKCPEDLSREERQIIQKKLRPKQSQKLIFSSIGYKKTVKSKSDVKLLHELSGHKFTLVTGIANPKPLIDFLSSKPLMFEHLKYPDHHFFSESEIENLKSKSLVLTTEKDYVRLKNYIDNLYYLEMQHTFDLEDEVILSNALKGFIEQF